MMYNNIVRKCFWKIAKYIQKEKNMIRYISDDLKISSHNSDWE